MLGFSSDASVHEVLRISLYDQSDPGNLYIASIDNEKFLKMTQKQNLVIEKFSQLAGHMQLLFDQVI